MSNINSNSNSTKDGHSKQKDNNSMHTALTLLSTHTAYSTPTLNTAIEIMELKARKMPKIESYEMIYIKL